MRLNRLLCAAAFAVALVGCAAGGGGAMRPFATMTLNPADASTNLLAGGPVTLTFASSAQAAAAGQDPLVRITLRRADGREMHFDQANHTPADLFAQRAGGPLAQTMGLFGEEAPTLYRASGPHAASFLCGPEGPLNVGFIEYADGGVVIVGLKQNFEIETLQDGSQAALPYSPDQVCARLRFTRG